MIRTENGLWLAEQGWVQKIGQQSVPSLLMVFGAGSALRQGALLAELRVSWPEAVILGCSTSGQIADVDIHEAAVVVTAFHFEHTRLQLVEAPLHTPEASYSVGFALGEQLNQPGLAHVLVLAEGLAINGSGLVKGFEAALPEQVRVTGGLAGDDDRFQETLIYTAQGLFSRHVAALGFYGDALRVGCGSCGGWDPFGVERRITRSEGNELFEMDGRPALALYASYLGDFADGLPATGLLFPLEVRQQEQTVVRTILAINPERGSLIFAGDVPEGAYARLMKTNYDHLLDGAAEAARQARDELVPPPQAALLVSCVGRKMVLKQRTEEELEEVQLVLGPQVGLTGFYSYGEIAPGVIPCESELHNQTMTITVFAEVGL